MKKNGLSLILFLVFALSSCVPNDKADSSFSSKGESMFSSSSIVRTSNQSSKKQPFSETSLFSQKASSFFSSLSSPLATSSSKNPGSSSSLSLGDKEYCDVSIYQYYKTADYRHHEGEIRFDLVIQVEQGQPLYSNNDEHDSIKKMLSPEYLPHGDGYWYCLSFFCDVECTTFYLSGTPILSDLSLYYYCGG